MIVPMKKVSLIMQSKDAVEAVAAVRSLGLLHVEHQQQPKGKDITALAESIALVNSACGILSVCAAAKKAQRQPSQPAEAFCRHVIDTAKRIEQLEEYGRSLTGMIAQWESWGDFDPQRINDLAAAGISARLFQVPAAEVSALPKGAIVKTLRIQAGIANCLVISSGPLQVPYAEVAAPKTSLSQMRRKLAEDTAAVAALKKELEHAAVSLAWLQEYRQRLEKDLTFAETVAGMGGQEGLVFIRGFIPADALGAVETQAHQQRWALLTEDPAEEDTVPTLLRNPRWVDMVKPVLGLLGITPGYRELDVSILFLVFFSLFFGILIGDAGYGLVYLLLTVWLHKKSAANPALHSTARLMYLLSSCAILWGVLTGTFFGQTWLLNLGFRAPVSQLNDVKVMQTFCFFLGALHLSLAHGWRAMLKAPSLSALADIGWIGVLWTAFMLARTLILGESFPSWGAWLIYVSVGLVILFTNPQRNVLKAIGEGLGTVALSLMNNFTDVVSYVRLFAVGLAGVAIAETTNAMAAGLGSGAVAVIFGGLIAVIGHALNIVLGPMSVLVHGVRLNVLEFSGHASVTWSGIAYTPLKE